MRVVMNLVPGFCPKIRFYNMVAAHLQAVKEELEGETKNAIAAFKSR